MASARRLSPGTTSEFMVVAAFLTLAVFLLLTGLALLWGRDDDPDQAFAEYVPYTPGHAVPTHVPCQPVWWEYPGESEALCELGATTYCQRGYLFAQHGMVTYLRLNDCELPVAYLVAQYGRYRRVRYSPRATILVWDHLSANLRRTEQFTLMYPASSVGWWQDSP